MLRFQCPSVHLPVTFVHCGHRVQWIPDTFACLDRWMSLLLTDNASPRSSDGMMPGFQVKEAFSQRVCQKKLKCHQRLQVVAIAMGYWLVDRRAGSADDATPCTDLVDELVLHKNCKSRNNNYLHTVLNSMFLLCTKYYQNWLMSV